MHTVLIVLGVLAVLGGLALAALKFLSDPNLYR